MTGTRRKRERLTDRFQVIPTWEDVSAAEGYAPQTHLPAAPEERSAPQEYQMVFAALVETGAWLLRAVAEHWPQADGLAAELEKLADLGRDDYEESKRESVAAAYLLWPYHAARYYGYTPGTTEQQRLASRQALVKIQALLYNNIRSLQDVMRLWFNSSSDAESATYVKEREMRVRWRPERLIDNSPDLCAVDFLAEHMFELSRVRPLIRRALETIQTLSLGANKVSKTDYETVTRVFRELRLAQMTVFYYPNPDYLGSREEISLYELVHDTRPEDPDADGPSKLIPFDGEETLAKNFRRLASKIYSAKSRALYPNFFEHRRATIGRLTELTSFISDGATTNFFLSTKPPARRVKEGEPPAVPASKEDEWPIWYSKALSDIAHDENLPDWSDWDFWWRPINCEDLRHLLFPGDGLDDVHRNDHMSAYWDEMARNGKFLDRVAIPEARPAGEASFGYLMELLLRRERQTRTSFFALAQTHEDRDPKLCQFVGGTFLGLERPGIPFSEERFKALAARVRGIVMAVAHYTTTHAVKEKRERDRLARNNFNKRVKTIMLLLRGRRLKKDDRFHRRGDLLFATRLSSGDSDHATAYLGPSRQQLRRVFHNSCHLPAATGGEPMAASCEYTWKALFYLGGDHKQAHTLALFLDKGWRQILEDPGDKLRLSDREVACPQCLIDVMEFLVGERPQSLRGKIEVPEGREGRFHLPTRPGIRFLICLSRFIFDVQKESGDERSKLTGVRFASGQVTLTFDNRLLIDVLARSGSAQARPNHTIGIFRSLLSGTPFAEGSERGDWQEFLNAPEFATPLTPEFDSENYQLHLRWEL